MELQEVFNTLPKTQIHGGIVTAFGLIFAWLILGRLVDLLLELIWMVWVGLTVSATCYLPTLWVYKRSSRVSMKKIFKKRLNLDDTLDKKFYAELAGEAAASTSSTSDVTHTETNSDNVVGTTKDKNNVTYQTPDSNTFASQPRKC